MKKSYYLLPIIILLISVASFYFQSRATDEYTYLSTAVKINHGTVTSLELERFPGYSFLLSLLFRIKQSENAAIALNILLLVGIATITARIGKRLNLNSKIIFLATITNPFLVFFSSRILTETVFSFLAILGVYYILKEKSFLTGIVAGIMFTFRYTGVLFGIAFLIVELTRKTKNWKSIALFTIGGLIAVSPLLTVNYNYTGNPVGLILQFVRQVSGGDQSNFSLPDKIPSYVLLTPFLAGVLILLLLNKKSKNKPNKQLLVVFLTFIIGMEAYSMFGVFNKPLLRYITVFSPMTVLLIFQIAKYYNKKLVYVLIFLNLIIGLAGAIYFNTHYQKNAEYKLTEDYIKTNCRTAYSNLPTITEWSNGKNTLIENNPECIVYTKYEGSIEVPKNYYLEKQFERIEIYRITNT